MLLSAVDAVLLLIAGAVGTATALVHDKPTAATAA
jgi:hypothetical protein